MKTTDKIVAVSAVIALGLTIIGWVANWKTAITELVLVGGGVLFVALCLGIYLWKKDEPAEKGTSLNNSPSGESFDLLVKQNYELNRENKELRDGHRKKDDELRELQEITKGLREAKQSLSAEGEKGDKDAAKAAELMREGKFDEAGEALDVLIQKGQANLKTLASHHYSRGQIFKLLNDNPSALKHFERAYQLDPENTDYVFAHALSLQKGCNFREAELVYAKLLERYRELARKDPGAYLPDVAMTLNNLGILHKNTGKLKEAEGEYGEALGIYKKLAEKAPGAYLPYVAGTFNNLGLLHSNTGKLKEAEGEYAEAVSLYEKLASVYPEAYGKNLGIARRNLDGLRQKMKQP
ncbi:tetratricopeptide repeat protein [bacterium]|nr:MAG: tetratricopeptide repeat protein [bacterium]